MKMLNAFLACDNDLVLPGPLQDTLSHSAAAQYGGRAAFAVLRLFSAMHQGAYLSRTRHRRHTMTFRSLRPTK